MKKDINNLFAVYFSPTGNAKKVCRIISKTISEAMNINIDEIDFTQLENRKENYEFSENDLVIFVFPTYAGRLPNKIAPDIKRTFLAKGTYAIPVCVFGNRNFDDSLIELKLILEDLGFSPLCAAAVVSEHAFSEKLAKGRPNEKDKKEIENFALKAIEKINAVDTYNKLNVPGNNPPAKYYIPLKEDKTPAMFLKAKPVTDTSLCNNCKRCVYVCPMESVNKVDPSKTDGICIKCQACIKVCNKNARYFEDKDFISHVKMLEENYTERKENEFFY